MNNLARRSCAYVAALTLGILIGTSYAFAGLNVWTTGGPFGGNVRQVVIDPAATSTVYLVAENKVYKSSNNGLSWSVVMNGLGGSPSRLAVDPTNSNKIYAATSAGVFKSSDGAANWSATSLAGNLGLLSINPQTPSIIYAANGNTLYRSLDSGGSWSAIASFSSLTQLFVVASSPSTLYALNNGDPMKSTDGGANWSVLTGLPTKSPLIGIDPSNSNVVYSGTNYGPSLGCLWKSTDGGANWSSTGGACFNYTFYDIEVAPGDSNNLLVSAYYGIYHSPDGGSTWVGVGGLTSSTNSLAIAPASSNVVFAGTQGGGVFRTTDGATSWSAKSNGLSPVGTGQLALARSNPSTLFVTGGGGIFKTADSGGHWSPISPGTSPVYSLAIDPLLADVIYVGGNYGPSFAGVNKSTDGGLSWLQTAHSPYPNVYSLAIAPGNSNIIYAGSGGGGAGVSGFLARTIDGGNNWPFVAQLSADANNLAVDWSDPNTVYAVSGGGLLKSTDGGVTWNPSNTGLSGIRSITVDPNNSQVLYAGANGGVFKSSNAGQSWNLTTLNKATNSVVVARGDSNKLYAGTGGLGVYQSTDAGATWLALNAGLSNLNVNSLAIDDTGRYLHASTSTGVFDYEYAPIAPATHLNVTAPQITTAGNNLPVTVTALDASNQKANNYNGTVHFSSSDLAAGLPGDYTFVVKANQQAASDSSILIQQDFNPLAVNGIGQQVLTSSPMTVNSITVQFNNTFPKNGYLYMDLVKDDGAGNPANSAADIIATSTNTNGGGGAGNFTFTFSSVPVPAGSFHIVVRTQHIASNGYSILSLNTSTRSTMTGLGAATIQNPSTGAWSTAAPTQYMTFSINDPIFGDAGQHVFNAVLKTVGVQSISANDIAAPTISGTQSGIVVQPNVSAGSLAVSGFPSPIIAGASGGFTVTVRDAYGNLDTGYKGTIHFTSSDSQATLPADYSFGRGLDQTNTGSSILIQQDFNPLAVSGIGQRVVTDSALTIDAVTVQFDNSFPKNGYAYMDLVKDDGTGKPSNSAADVLGTSSNVNGGGGAGNFTFNFPAITVPAGAFHLVVRTQNISSNGYSIFSETTGSSSTLPGLSPVMVQNPATGQWSNATPAQYMYFSIAGGEGGTHTFNASLRTAGLQSITATDIAAPAVTGTQSNIQVQAPAPTPTPIPAANIQRWSVNNGFYTLAEFGDGTLLAAGDTFASGAGTGVRMNPADGSTIGAFPVPDVRTSIRLSTGDQDYVVGGYGDRVEVREDGSFVRQLFTLGCCNIPRYPLALNHVRDQGYVQANGALGIVNMSTGAFNYIFGAVDSFGMISIADANTLYTAGQQGDVIRLSPDTGHQWHVHIDNNRLQPGAVTADGSFIVASGPAHLEDSPQPGRLARVRPDGSVAWNNLVNAVTPPVIGSNNLVFVGTQPPPINANSAGAIEAYDLTTGNLVWRTSVLGLPNDLLVGDDAAVYAGTGSFASGQVYALAQSDGAVRETITNVPGAWEIILNRGLLYASGNAITALPVAAIKYDPNSPWPVRFHDNQRTGNRLAPAPTPQPTPTTITWNNPADITYGTPLSAAQLNASANVPGTFAYTPQAGTILNAGNGQTLSVIFTPEDQSTYSTSSKQVTININKRDANWTTNPNSKALGASDPVPLTTGGGSAFLAGDGVTAIYSRVAGETVAGSPYHITTTLNAGRAGALANYNITNNGADFIILPPTTTSLTSAPNPAPYLTPIAFNLSVSSVGTLPTGIVTVSDGNNLLLTDFLDNTGHVFFSISTLSVGPHQITASYSGDARHLPSTSAVLVQVVKSLTTTSLLSSLSPSVFGQAVTLTASVGSNGGTPTGTVQLFDYAQSIGTVSLSAGHASVTTASLAAGSHSITAVYSGDTNFLGSTSAALIQTVSARTPPGSNVTIHEQAGSTTVQIEFTTVTAGGTTSIVPISPSAAGTMPGGFSLPGLNLAFDITSTATFLGPVTVCFKVPSVTDPTAFSRLRVLHSVPKSDLAAANFSGGNVSVLLGNGGGAFGTPTNLTAGSGPEWLAKGDFNGDGRPDLAVVNATGNNVSVFLGDGTGGFGAATNFAVGTAPYSIAVGDFNGDGKPDLATANTGSNNVSVLLGNGAGSFGAATNFAVAGRPRSVAVGDFNGDGKHDLATANDPSNNVSILLGNGQGGFSAAANFAAGNAPSSVAVGDFNRDGKLDLAVANYVGKNVSILLGNGAGGFGSPTNFAAGPNPYSVAVGDLNGDGKLDVAVGNALFGSVAILMGNGAGGFAPATFFGMGVGSVVLADFNNDSKLDLATGNATGGFTGILVRLGLGNGGFGGQTTFRAGNGPTGLAVGNFNGDVTVIDQTILSGPDAPNFATKMICARVLSFSPIVIASADDQTSPVISNVSADPSVIWPPNHDMIDVTINYDVSDDFTAAPDIISSLDVSCNEPVNTTGDGNTEPDIEIVDAHHVRLRAERAGNGDGRVYTITITCTDSAQNASQRTVTVRVPKSQ